MEPQTWNRTNEHGKFRMRNSGLACKGQRCELLTVCCGVVGVRDAACQAGKLSLTEGGGH